MLPIQNGLMQGDILLPLLFKVFQQIVVCKTQENQKVHELIGAHQLLVYGVKFFPRNATKYR